jgi:hypothetical protein
LELGDRVAARWGGAFWEGTVLGVEGRLVTVAWDQPPPERSPVARELCVRLGAAAAGAEAGRWRLCPQTARWLPCRSEGPGRATLADGSEVTAPVTLPLPEGLELWARQRAEAELAQALLLRRLAEARPAAAGQPVAAGQLVMAHWDGGGWWRARASAAVAGGRVSVEWADGSGRSELPASDVAPLGGPVLDADAIALCLQAGSTRYQPAQVKGSAAGRSGLVVTWADGSKGAVAPADCLPARVP